MRKSMAVMVTALILMGLIAAALEPELFPRAISNKIETFYLGKLSDPSKVYLQKGIEKPGRVLELKMARIKEQKYHQDDLQVERREFLFHNGDLYWHDKITLKEGTGDLNYVINYEGNNGILTYYNESRDKWEEQELANGTLPFTDLFLTIDNKHIILTQPLIYQDLGPGVVKALLKNSTGSSSPYLQKLMDAKKEYMDLNGISAYKKTALGESFGYPSTWPKLEILYGDKQLSWIRGDSNFTGEPGGVIGNTMFGMNEEHLEQMPTNPVEAGAELCFMADEVPGLNQPVFQMQILNQNGTFSSYPINQNTILLPEKTGEYIFILSADWGNGDNNILYWFKVLLDETP